MAKLNTGLSHADVTKASIQCATQAAIVVRVSVRKASDETPVGFAYWIMIAVVLLQMRVATERAKLVRGITASFKKLSKSSEVSLARHALPDMMLHCSKSQLQ